MDKDNNKLAAGHKRNAGAAIIDGYHLYLKNLATIIRRTWPIALFYALTIGFIGYYSFMKVMPLTHGSSMPAKELIVLGIAILVYLLLVLLLVSTTVKLLNEHRSNGMITKGRWYGELHLKNIPTVFRVFWRILRRFWRYLAVTLVVFIITTIVSLFMESSAIYLSIAHLEAQESFMMEDPYQMPEHIGLITFVVFTFSALLQAYIHMSSLFPFYYAYDSNQQQ